MAETNFTLNNENFPQMENSCSSSYISSASLPGRLPSSPPLAPLAANKRKDLKEQSREERMRLYKHRVLQRYRQKLTNSQLPGFEYGLAYIEHKARQGLVAKTLQNSGGITLSFLSFIDSKGQSLEEISKADIEAYVENCQDKGVSIATVHTTLTMLYPFLSFLADRQVVDSRILVNKLKVKLPDPLPRAMNDEDVASLLLVLDDVRDRAMILLLLRTGMRIGEMLELQVSEVNLKEQKIIIYLGEKNYQGRVVCFSDDAKGALLAWLGHRNPEKKYLFYGQQGNPLSNVSAWRRITNCFKRAGLSHKGYTPHCLRHTFATEALNAGMRLEVVQQLLGHMSIEITQRYAKLTDITREGEYFRAMSKIEKGGRQDEPNRLNRELQAVFEKKKFFTSHN